LKENHKKVHGFPDLLQRGTSREQLCAALFMESRMQFGGTTDLPGNPGSVYTNV